MTRRPMVAANWKMHGQLTQVADLADVMVEDLGREFRAEIVICPAFVYLPRLEQAFRGTHLKLGGQNLHHKSHGAYTGEVSGTMLLESGCHYVIVGHSERRELFGETDDLVAAKFAAAQASGLIPILCLGETQAQRETGITDEVVREQLEAVISACGIGAFDNAVIAYEPVWAIGTGLTATPEQAQQVHALIRAVLHERDPARAAAMRILYGGSVKAANAGSLFGQPDIDGGLVGGASLIAEEFRVICEAAVSSQTMVGMT